MALGYGVASIGMFFQIVDGLSYLYQTDDFKNWLRETFASDPKLLAWVFTILGLLVIIARLRSILGWGVPK